MNSQLEKLDESKLKILPRHVHTSSVTVMVKLISIINLSETNSKNSLTNHFRRTRNVLLALHWRTMVTKKKFLCKQWLFEKPWELYTNIKGVGVYSKQSINIKELIEKRLEGKIQCCMPKSARSTQSECVRSADVNILSHAIDNIITAESVTNFVQLRTISCSILLDIQMNL